MDKFLIRKRKTSSGSESKDNDNDEQPDKKRALDCVASDASLATSIDRFISSKGTQEFRKIRDRDLDLDYAVLFRKTLADEIFQHLAKNIDFHDDEIKVFGKYHKIPRKQATFGDRDLAYKFSGIKVQAKPWDSVLEMLRNKMSELAKCQFNFVLINRYANGNDHIGEHRDDERELDHSAPIASLTFGQAGDFVLRHAVRRLKEPNNTAPENHKILLEHGSLLLMNPPTNKKWYHSVPIRKSAVGVRFNLTFRKILPSQN